MYIRHTVALLLFSCAFLSIGGCGNSESKNNTPDVRPRNKKKKNDDQAIKRHQRGNTIPTTTTVAPVARTRTGHGGFDGGATSTTKSPAGNSFTKPGSGSGSSSGEKPPEHKPAPVEIQEAGLRGLENFGTTCYINSLLQALMHLEPMRNELAGKESDARPIVRSLAALFSEEWNRNGPPITPDNMVTSLSKLNPELFTRYEQQDAHEAFVVISASLGFDMFAFLTRSRISCDGGLSYRAPTTEIQTNYLLSFPKGKGPFGLAQMIHHTFEPEAIKKVEACGNGVGQKRVSLYSVPEVLVLAFHRNVSRANKIDTAVSIDERINASIFPGLEGSDIQYRLVSIIHHHGGSVAGGHYTADFLKDGQWWDASDTDVSRMTPGVSKVSKTATILFYHRQ